MMKPNETILEKYRKRLKKIALNGGYDLDCALRDYEPSFYQRLDDISNPYFSFFTTLELLTYYTDFYMVMNAKKKEVALDIEEFELLTLCVDIHNFDDLVAEILATSFLLEEMMKASLKVEGLSFLGRTHLYHYLEEEDKENILKINPTFMEEEQIYNRFIEPKDYIYHFKEQLRKYERVMGEEAPHLVKDAVVEEICGFLKNLSLYDYDNYVGNIEEMALFHYAYLKYASTLQMELALYTKEEIEEVIQYLEEEDMPTLAADLFSSCNYGYLKEMVWFYLENQEKGFLEDQKAGKITYEEVCAYIEKDKKTKEKIKDNKTRI